MPNLTTSQKRQLVKKVRASRDRLKERNRARDMAAILEADDGVYEPVEVLVERPVWPERHVPGLDGNPVPFHRAQEIAFDSALRIIAVLAGSQGGKTVFGPIWLWDEIQRRGPGDYIAATATYDLFKLKMLPSLLHFFVDVLGIGKYWASNRIIELADPDTGEFGARFADDLNSMWGKIILRSADAKGGLESATALAAWLDEAGQPRFDWDAYKGVRRRVATTGGRILITTTLYGVDWLTKFVLDKATGAEDARVQIESVDRGEGVSGEVETTTSAEADICVVQYDSIVNTAFPVKEFKEAERDLPPDEFAMFYRGRKGQGRLLVLSSFNPDRHQCPDFPIPVGWSRYLGMDYGPTNTAGIKLAVNPRTKKIYLYGEYLAGGRTTAGHADHLLAGEPHGFRIASGGTKSSEEQWRREFRAAGLHVIEPKVSDLATGLARVYAAFSQGRLIIFDSCFGILDEISRYRFKRDAEGNLTREIEKKATFHRIDALRYIVQFLVASITVDHDALDGLGSVEGYETPWD